jgi:hypothetical protein
MCISCVLINKYTSLSTIYALPIQSITLIPQSPASYYLLPQDHGAYPNHPYNLRSKWHSNMAKTYDYVECSYLEKIVLVLGLTPDGSRR